MDEKRIGIIGAGTMGEAVISALLLAKHSPSRINVIEKRHDRLEEITTKFGIGAEPIASCNVVFLLVKPQDCEETLRIMSKDLDENVLVVSFVAGKKLSLIESFLSASQSAIRVMPNTPMTAGKGLCAISLGKSVTDEDAKWLEAKLSSSSVVITIPEELQDAITALSGSGPAYFFALVEAMADAGQRLGLKKADSIEAAKQVLIGAAAMVEGSGKDPETLRENVTSPNGTTFAALRKLEEEGFSELIYEAMKASRDRSIELGIRQ